MVNLFTLAEGGFLVFFLKLIGIIITAFVLKLIFDVGFLLRLRYLNRIESVEERREKFTRVEFARKIFSTAIFVIAFVSILFLIPGFKTFSISLLAGAGIAAIVIGFAAQKTLANFFSGISIAYFTPFRVGDRLKVGEDFGDVEDINLRHTVIKTWDNRRIIIPNSIISEKEIINFSIKEERVLWTINMGISYDSNIDKAKKIMLEKANKHPNIIIPEIKDEKGKKEKKIPKVRVTECGDFAVNLRLYFWVAKPDDAWTTSFDLIEQIKKEFDKQGIEIPFPYRTIVYKKDLEKEKMKNSIN